MRGLRGLRPRWRWGEGVGDCGGGTEIGGGEKWFKTRGEGYGVGQDWRVRGGPLVEFIVCVWVRRVMSSGVRQSIDSREFELAVVRDLWCTASNSAARYTLLVPISRDETFIPLSFANLLYRRS